MESKYMVVNKKLSYIIIVVKEKNIALLPTKNNVCIMIVVKDETIVLSQIKKNICFVVKFKLQLGHQWTNNSVVVNVIQLHGRE